MYQACDDGDNHEFVTKLKFKQEVKLDLYKRVDGQANPQQEAGGGGGGGRKARSAALVHGWRTGRTQQPLKGWVFFPPEVQNGGGHRNNEKCEVYFMFGI